MHKTSLDNMRSLIERHLDRSAPLVILDVGSYDVNGTYRLLFECGNWAYVGTDIKAGPNVDVVMPYADKLPADDNSVDVVVSGQCLEHVEFPWLTIREMARVLRPGGKLLLIAPSQGHEHRYPLDTYRYLPDGYRALAKWAGLEVLEVYRDKGGMWRDCCGVFRKPYESTCHTCGCGPCECLPWPKDESVLCKDADEALAMARSLGVNTHWGGGE